MSLASDNQYSQNIGSMKSQGVDSNLKQIDGDDDPLTKPYEFP